MDKFYKTNRVTADEHDTGKGLFTYSDFSIRLIAIYLSGKQNLHIVCLELLNSLFIMPV